MGVGTVRDELVALLLEDSLEGLGVGNNLLLVSLELGGGGLLEGNGKSGDGVVVGAALVPGEDGEVDLVLEVVEGFLAGLGINGADALAEEDHGTTGTTEGLVSGGGDDIGILERSGDDAGGNETRDVGNVDNEVGTNRVGNLAHALVIDEAAVGRSTGDEDLGAEELSVLLELVVVNDASVKVDTVGHGLEVGGDSRDPREAHVSSLWGNVDPGKAGKCLLALGGLVTVAQMATVGEVETHESAVRRHDGLVDLEVGRAAAQALNVDTPLRGVEVEGLKGTLLAEKLDLVDVLVAAIVTSAGETLRVLVGHGGAEGIENSAGGDVLGGDEDDGLALTLDLVLL